MSGNLREPRALAQSVAALLAVVAALSPLAAKPSGGLDETTTMNRIRRVALAALAYTEDNDRVLPLSTSFNTVQNRWRIGTYTAVPNGWTSTGGRSFFPRVVEERSMVLNAIPGYGVATRDYEASGMPIHGAGLDPELKHEANLLPKKVSVSFNGQLHSWPVDAVATPTRLPLFTENYRENTVGANVSLPMICCTDPGAACRFDPVGYPQPGQTVCAFYGPGYGFVWFLSTATENFSVWAYEHRLVFARVDGSVESRQLEAPIWPQYAYNVNENPWSSYDPAGVPGSPYWMTECVLPGGEKSNRNNTRYAGYYRPDNEFNYTLQQCDFGGG